MTSLLQFLALPFFLMGAFIFGSGFLHGMRPDTLPWSIFLALCASVPGIILWSMGTAWAKRQKRLAIMEEAARLAILQHNKIS